MKGIGMKMFSGYSVAAAMLAAATLAGCPAPELHTQELKGSNTLAGTQVYFIPTDGSKRVDDNDYARFVNQEAGLTVPVGAGHNPVAVGAVTELAEPIMFFGVFYNNIVVGANGTVVLSNDNAASVGANGNLTDHFQSRQVSLLPLDAALQGDADVTLLESDDLVVVTYQGATVTVGEAVVNAFQVVFQKSRGVDGDLIISYADVNPNGTTGVVGLSDAPLAGKSESEIADFLGRFGAGNNLGESSANTPDAA